MEKSPLTLLRPFIFIICISLLLLALIQRITAPSIESNQAAAAKQLIESILPEEYLGLLTSEHLESLKKSDSTQLIQHCETAFVTLMRTQAKGYSSELNVITSIQTSTDTLNQQTQRIIGVRVIPPQQETPGLGDIIMFDKSTWVLQFDNLKVPLAKELAEQVDYVTGATISTQAVMKAVSRTLQNPLPQPACY